MEKKRNPYAPQPGPQTAFLASPADITIYGGAAGGGKTYALLLEAMRNYENPAYRAGLFRRELSALKAGGSIWDESKKLYRATGAKSHEVEKRWTFPSGAQVGFFGVQREDDVLNFQGSQFTFLGFDELTHFSERQFTYLRSRLRSSDSKLKSYIRATCNPDRNSWVRNYIEWWIDPETGYAIPERSGVIRYFRRNRVDDSLEWFDEPVEFGTSFTFIPATLADNKILSDSDPEYRSRLESMQEIEYEQLYKGNWNISSADFGQLILGEDFVRYDASLDEMGRYAYTPPFQSVYVVGDTAMKTGQQNDFSVFMLFGKTKENRYYILDLIRGKFESHILRQRIIDHWEGWKRKYPRLRALYIEDKSSGTGLLQELKAKGIPVLPLVPNRDKYARLQDVIPKIKNGFVYIPYKADWIAEFVRECELFRDKMKGGHDDQVDALSYALSAQCDLKRGLSPLTPQAMQMLRNSGVHHV